MENQLRIVDFHDFSRFLGKSGMDLIHPPKPQRKVTGHGHQNTPVLDNKSKAGHSVPSPNGAWPECKRPGRRAEREHDPVAGHELALHQGLLAPILIAEFSIGNI